LAVVKDGDMIEMDIASRALNLLIPDKELQERIQNWAPPKPRVTDGFLTVYARLANPAAKGAGINLRLE
jgi:dihydroxy-acid dehydratase